MLARRRRDAARIGDAPQAIAEIDYADLGPAERECDAFLRETDARPRRLAEGFMTGDPPGVIATILLSSYYGPEQQTLEGSNRVTPQEYHRITRPGRLRQLDRP